MFWEASRDVRGKASLLKYDWIERTITATALTAGYFLGDVPPRLMLLIVFTNWLWIPCEVAGSGGDLPSTGSALREAWTTYRRPL